MKLSVVLIKDVCDWIRSNPYTDTISNITDVTPEEIIGDFLNYINNLPDA